MKKVLMAATALAVSGGAFAAAPAAADDHAGEGFQLKIGGFYNALAIVRDQDDPVSPSGEAEQELILIPLAVTARATSRTSTSTSAAVTSSRARRRWTTG
ncbi:hypothetical protein [Fodinicurvata halophila]|uniref:hypothetical protein n=1 Tax=Fodinicurvata halophila TaxID=1419723 RepID=UPI00363C5049